MAQPKTAPARPPGGGLGVAPELRGTNHVAARVEAHEAVLLARNAHRGDVFGDRARGLERRGDGDADALHPRLGVLFGGVGATGGREEAVRQRATTGNLVRLEVVQDRLRALGANIETERISTGRGGSGERARASADARRASSRAPRGTSVSAPIARSGVETRSCPSPEEGEYVRRNR